MRNRPIFYLKIGGYSHQTIFGTDFKIGGRRWPTVRKMVLCELGFTSDSLTMFSIIILDCTHLPT